MEDRHVSGRVARAVAYDPASWLYACQTLFRNVCEFVTVPLTERIPDQLRRPRVRPEFVLPLTISTSSAEA
jgi:hypothetical protein